jgi:O-antigen/teichoic acid export membrane protein
MLRLEPVQTRIQTFLQTSDLRRRVVSGASWTIVGSVLGQGSTFLVTLVCAKSLGPKEFGKLALILSTQNLFAVLASAGLGVTVTKYVAEYREKQPEKASRVVSSSLLLTASIGALTMAIFAAFASWIATRQLNAPELGPELRIAAIATLFSAISSVPQAALVGLEAFRTSAHVQLFRALISLPFVYFGLLRAGIEGAMWAQVAISATVCLASLEAARRIFPSHKLQFGIKPHPGEAAALCRFGMPVLVAGLAFAPAVWISNVLLARRAGYVEVGVFNVSYQWLSLILFLSNCMAAMGLPLMASSIGDRNIAKFRHRVRVSCMITVIPAIAFAVPVFLGSPFIMSFYGKAFRGGWLCLSLLCLSAVMSSAGTTVGQIIWSLNATGAGVSWALIRGVILVVGAYFLVGFGAAGLAVAYCIMFLIQTFGTYFHTERIIARLDKSWQDEARRNAA